MRFRKFIKNFTNESFFKGLCGAVHTGIVRSIRGELADDPSIHVFCVGDKSRSIMQRNFSKQILCVANEVSYLNFPLNNFSLHNRFQIGRLPPSFLDAAKLANEIMNLGYEFTDGRIIYNRFKSVVSYSVTDLPLYSLKSVETAPKLAVYDSLDTDVLQSYMEFSLASMLFYAMKEGACSEQSSRMTAMDNASKNAGEMIDKLTLTFNRTRQAVITRELIEIISGAAALE